ncbi:unnamed protein product [Closterium sp. Naga37s-1]|nr:unnamed protein product [Closterium sp. Naga37s-1]
MAGPSDMTPELWNEFVANMRREIEREVRDRILGELQERGLLGTQVPAPAPAVVSARPRAPEPEPFVPGKRDLPVRRWLFQMEEYLSLCHVNQAEWARHAGMMLRGAAATWWQSCHTTISTWEEFSASLTMNFEPVNAIERARDNLAALRQHRSVAEYVNRFRELVLEIPDIPASEQMDKFKRGLKPKIRTEVELRGCTSMDDMIRVAERFDTINFAAFQRFNGMRMAAKYLKRHVPPMREDGTHQAELPESSQPERRTGKRTAPVAVGQTSGASHAPLLPTPLFIGTSELYTTSNAPFPAIILYAKIKNRYVDFLLDTGASVNFLSPSIAAELSLPEDPNSNPQAVIMADGTRRHCGPTLLPVHCMFGSLEATFRFVNPPTPTCPIPIFPYPPSPSSSHSSRAAANTTRLSRSDQHTSSFSTPPNPAATPSHHPPHL